VSRKKDLIASEADPTTLGPVLVDICHLHHRRAHTVFENIGVYRGQPPILAALWEHDGQTHSELAAQLRVKPATITRMVQRMEHAGLLAREQDANDQRVSRVYLTAAGRKIRNATLRAVHTIDTDMFQGFTPKECSTLQALLMRVQANLLRANNMEEDK
jgi:DNA-binding MarR family transcriptional regulator